MTTPASDFDSPWKEALEEYLKEFFALLLPHIHDDIDWSRPYAFLDKELQQAVREAETGRRVVDKLVQVWLRSGAGIWVLIHIEVQSQQESGFAERMFVYFYRLYDRFKRQVVSIAVLADERARWRPRQFKLALWGCSNQFTFPIVKLLDYRKRQQELEASANPFSIVVLAHLAAQRTRRNMRQRQQTKLRLTRLLYERGYNRERIQSLFRFIDWLLALPQEREAEFWHDVQAYEEEQRMPYVTSVERMGIERGRAEGLREGLRKAIRSILQGRFGPLTSEQEMQIAVADTAALERMIVRLSTANEAKDVLEEND